MLASTIIKDDGKEGRGKALNIIQIFEYLNELNESGTIIHLFQHQHYIPNMTNMFWNLYKLCIDAARLDIKEEIVYPSHKI